MGALSSIMSYAPLIKEGFDIISGGAENEIDYREQQAQQRQALKQLKQRQRLAEKQQVQNNALKREEIAAKARSEERKRMDALRRAVARQRAAFGNQGISAKDGSAEAVLLGLFEETDENRQERERLDNLRNRALSAGESQKRSLNILEQQQLRQRQQLNRASSSFGRSTNAIDTAFDLVDVAGRLGGV